MFNSIRGEVTDRRSDTVRLEANGIEWEFSVPATDAERFPSPGGEARVFVWLYHREDQMRLYGFIDERRRETFLELMKVEGIGPKQALKIMGGISQKDLETALEAGDIGRLEAVPGLGKKTAQKMILALKGRIVAPEEKTAAQTVHGELAEALVAMGYDRRAAVEAILRAEKEQDGTASGEALEKLLFKRAIVLLSGA